jgi:hypothetical protein
MTEIQKNLFYSVLGSRKIDGKSIIEFAKTADEKGKTKIIRTVKQIVKSILESEILDIDEQGNIKDIRKGEQQGAVLSAIAGDSLIKRLEKNIANTPYFDPSLHEIEEAKTDDSKIEIKTVTAGQEKVSEQTNEVQKVIEATDADTVYPGRGLVNFDPEKNVLTSRGKTIRINPDTLTLE